MGVLVVLMVALMMVSVVVSVVVLVLKLVVLVLSDADIKVGTCWKINRGGGCLVGRVDK